MRSEETAKKPIRTDADGPYRPPKNLKKGESDDSPQWYQLVDGEFPPEGAAHAISGELIQVDHLERRFQIRVDRNDSQDRGVWDLPLDAVMLPHGSIWYLGAQAALQDIPLGTHLHGQFFLRSPDDTTPPPDTPNQRVTPEVDFRRCFRLEDDFSHFAARKERWKVDSADLAGMKLNATLEDAEGKAIGESKSFDLLTGTQVFQEGGFADLKAIQPGQKVRFNLTWGTLYGPGRITDLWLDEKSQVLATARQLERHRNHIRERGLAGWVTSVDDREQIVTITFFGGVDETLLTEWQNQDVTTGGVAVARESLMTYDPVNDRKGGEILEVKKIPVEPGSSGVQMRIKVDMMLEGYRPKRIVRFYPAPWKVIALPREEEYFGRE
ncbi:MAG: hypothetical protein KDM64_08415 [Verrucomicrobiae bacterium]|nr:hypothetical protein [Verrucomicrobiae bacterium]